MKKNILKIILPVLLGVLLYQPVFCQAPEEKALLWKISGNDLEKPSYLYGTIHIICSDKFNMSEAMLKAVESADKIALEIDMDDPELPAKMQQASINPGMKNIKEQIATDKIEIVDNFLQSKYQQGLAQLGILKPFVLSSMVLVAGMDCETSQYEAEFVKLAQAQEKEIIGLETLEFQVSLFDDIDIKTQIKSLVESIEHPEKNEKMMEDLMEAYQKEDLNAMNEIMKDREEFEGFYENFLVKRNKNWIPVIKSASEKESVFYAVGAGHLAGEDGVITLLRKEGFQVEPVK